MQEVPILDGTVVDPTSAPDVFSADVALRVKTVEGNKFFLKPGWVIGNDGFIMGQIDTGSDQAYMIPVSRVSFMVLEKINGQSSKS